MHMLAVPKSCPIAAKDTAIGTLHAGSKVSCRGLSTAATPLHVNNFWYRQLYAVYESAPHNCFQLVQVVAGTTQIEASCPTLPNTHVIKG